MYTSFFDAKIRHLATHSPIALCISQFNFIIDLSTCFPFPRCPSLPTNNLALMVVYCITQAPLKVCSSHCLSTSLQHSTASISDLIFIQQSNTSLVTKEKGRGGGVMYLPLHIYNHHTTSHCAKGERDFKFTTPPTYSNIDVKRSTTLPTYLDTL